MTAETLSTYVRNTTGVIELDRPKALNSLNPEMIRGIKEILEQWRDDAAVTQVLVRSTSPKAFCAGGDVRVARDGVVAGNFEETDGFFEVEYAMNNLIGTYPKPYIALIDGVAMGGGLGISAHGSHRIVSDKAFAAMPEMNIGYITDVGLSYSSQRMVGTRGKPSPELALFWATTAYRMYAADMLWTGLATHYVPDITEELVDDIIARGVDAALADAAQTPDGEAPLVVLASAIEETFAPGSWEEITAAVAAHPNEELKKLVTEATAAASPTSLVAAVELFKANANVADLRAGLDNEYAVGTYLLRQPDFVEGVRAVLVDKTKDPQFQPASVAEVDKEAIVALLSYGG